MSVWGREGELRSDLEELVANRLGQIREDLELLLLQGLQLVEGDLGFGRELGDLKLANTSLWKTFSFGKSEKYPKPYEK